MTKAPPGGKAPGPHPTARGKRDTQRHGLTQGAGLPISVIVTGANRLDKTQVEGVLDTRPSLPPLPPQEDPQHF